MRTAFIAIICLILGFVSGYFYDPDTVLGNARGGARTGFYLMAGEQIGIGTSSLTYDFEIASHSTSTILLDKDFTATTTGGCIIGADMDRAGYTYCYFNNGSLTCSSTDICK